MNKQKQAAKKQLNASQAILEEMLAGVDQADAKIKEFELQELSNQLPAQPDASSYLTYLEYYKLKSEIINDNKGNVAAQRDILILVKQLIAQFHTENNDEKAWDCLQQVQLGLIRTIRRSDNKFSGIEEIKNELVSLWFQDGVFKKLVKIPGHNLTQRMLQANAELLYDYFNYVLDYLREHSEPSIPIQALKVNLMFALSELCLLIVRKNCKIDLFCTKHILHMLLISGDDQGFTRACPLSFANLAGYLREEDRRTSEQQTNLQMIFRRYQITDEVRRTDLIARLAQSLLHDQANQAEDLVRLESDPSLRVLACSVAAKLALDANRPDQARKLMFQSRALIADGSNGGLALEFIFLLHPVIYSDHKFLHSILNMIMNDRSQLFQSIKKHNATTVVNCSNGNHSSAQTLVSAWLNCIKQLESVFQTRKLLPAKATPLLQSCLALVHCYEANQTAQVARAQTADRAQINLQSWMDLAMLLNAWQLVCAYEEVNQNTDSFKSKLGEVIQSFNRVLLRESSRADFITALKFFGLEDEYLRWCARTWWQALSGETKDTHCAARKDGNSLADLLSETPLALRCKIYDHLFTLFLKKRDTSKVISLMAICVAQIVRDVSTLEATPQQVTKKDYDEFFETAMYWRIRYFDLIDQHHEEIMQLSVLYLALPIDTRLDGATRKRQISNIRLAVAQHCVPLASASSAGSVTVFSYLVNHANQLWLFTLTPAQLQSFFSINFITSPSQDDISLLTNGLESLGLALDFIAKEIGISQNRQWQSDHAFTQLLNNILILVQHMNAFFCERDEMLFPEQDSLEFYLNALVFLRAFAPQLLAQVQLELNKAFITLTRKLEVLDINQRHLYFRDESSMPARTYITTVQTHLTYLFLLDQLKLVSPRYIASVPTHPKPAVTDSMDNIFRELLATSDIQSQWSVLKRLPDLINVCDATQFTALGQTLASAQLSKFCNRSPLLCLSVHNSQVLYFILAVALRVHGVSDMTFVQTTAEHLSKLRTDLQTPHHYLSFWFQFHQFIFPEPLPEWINCLLDLQQALHRRDVLDAGQFIQNLLAYSFPSRSDTPGAYWLACELYSMVLRRWFTSHDSSSNAMLQISAKHLKSYLKSKVPESALGDIECLVGKELLAVFPEEKPMVSKRKNKGGGSTMTTAKEETEVDVSAASVPVAKPAEIVGLPETIHSTATSISTTSDNLEFSYSPKAAARCEVIGAKPTLPRHSEQRVASTLQSQPPVPTKPSFSASVLTNKPRPPQSTAAKRVPQSRQHTNVTPALPVSASVVETGAVSAANASSGQNWQPELFKSATLIAPSPVRGTVPSFLFDPTAFPPLPSKPAAAKMLSAPLPVADTTASAKPVLASEADRTAQVLDNAKNLRLSHSDDEKEKLLRTQEAELATLRTQLANAQVEKDGLMMQLFGTQQALVAATARIKQVEPLLGQKQYNESSLKSLLIERDWLNKLVMYYSGCLTTSGYVVSRQEILRLREEFERERASAALEVAGAASNADPASIASPNIKPNGFH